MALVVITNRIQIFFMYDLKYVKHKQSSSNLIYILK